MSRLSIKPIIVPEKTTVTIDGVTVRAKGPLGELVRTFSPEVSIVLNGNEIKVSIPKPSKHNKALDGTTVSHIKNMLSGVNTLFEKKLVYEGVGFKADAKGDILVMALGFSHPVNVPIPKDLKVVTEKGAITVSGIDKERVGQFAATVRSHKEPEPYKGKGIRYHNEVIRRKQGKKTA